MGRVADWEVILFTKIKASQDLVFKLGTTDCTTWSIEVLKSYTDLKYTAPYTTYREAIKIQKSGKMRAIADSILGPSRNTIYANRGDLVMMNTGEKSTLGICLGENSAFLADTGITMYPTLSCECSWRV